ncbi:MAG: FAD/NAD(P)-binding protein [Candidatus Omnitrophota bacterium]|nr:MAG: FAD/NAD(P)-binding protein [Candidatus Omnitrophota bacterium]
MERINNPYRPIEAEVLKVITETPTIKTIHFKPKEPIRFATGQFVEITIPGVGEAPFTPSSPPSEKETMQVSVMKVGKVTDKIHELKKGDAIGVRGPFGNGYPVDEFKGKEILVVGGGCGFAPLRSLMYEFFDRSGQLKKLFFRGGCKTPKELVYHDETKEWAKRKDLNLKLTVDAADSSWKGNVGVVTTILDDVKMDYKKGIGVVCGPPIMMKFATKKLLHMGFKEDNIYLSMEKNMSCGIGKCGHCRLGTYYACKDGPVFKYSEIKKLPEIWD